MARILFFANQYHHQIMAFTYGLLVAVWARSLIRRLSKADTRDAALRYDAKNSCFYRLGYDSSNHVYFKEKLSIRKRENNDSCFQETVFETDGIISFSEYKKLGGADKRNREKPVAREE